MSNIDFTSLKMEYEINFSPVSPGVYQATAPFIHSDGDRLEIYCRNSPAGNNLVEITDLGLTLMHLSYSTDIDKESNRNFISAVIREQGFKNIDGELVFEVPADSLETYLSYYAQGLSKVMSATAMTKDTRESVFYEQVHSFVFDSLKKFSPVEKFSPISQNDEYVVDYMFSTNSNKPIFLFPVKNSYKAREVVSTVLFLQNKHVPFRSVAVYEDLDKMTNRDKRKIVNVTDKSFYTLEDFRSGGEEYLDREVS